MLGRLQNILRASGRELAPYPHPATFDGHLQRLLGDIDTVIDVGAHVGEFAQRVRAAGFRGRIVSFEPNPTASTQLEVAAAADPAWEVRQRALGDAGGSAELQLFDVPQLNSLHQPSDWADEHWNFHQVGTVQVDVARLDAEDGLDGRLFLKVDTQGHDLAVLRGAEALLGRVRLIQLEVGLKPLYDGSGDLASTVAALDDYGFGIVGLFPAVRENEGGHSSSAAIVELDCLAAPRR